MTNKTYKKIAILLAVGAILAIGGYVAALYGSSGPDAAPNLSEYGLVGYWNMEEGKGQTVYDRSGNANNGTLGASTSVAKDDPVFTSGYSSAGPGGTALKFDGVDDYVDTGSGSSLDIGNTYTIGAWLKVNSSNDSAAIAFWANQGAGYYNYSHYITSTTFSTKNGAGGSCSELSWTHGVNIAQWHDWVLVRSGLNETLYVDGVNKGAGTINSLCSAGNLIRAIGVRRYWNGSSVVSVYFSGSIDEVRIYNRALSADEIRQHYNQKKPVLEWKFDEGSGTAVHDEGFNNYDGTLHE